jgi:hypothetical protein
MRDYLKTKLEAERQSLKDYRATFGSGSPRTISAGHATIDTTITARIAMLEEIMADLDLANRREELAGLHGQLHDERREAWVSHSEATEHWKQRNDPDHTHCSDCGDLIDSASRGCESAGDGAGCRGFE